MQTLKKYPVQKARGVFGDPNGIRTHDTTVKGWCLNRLTMGPQAAMLVAADGFEPSTCRV